MRSASMLCNIPSRGLIRSQSRLCNSRRLIQLARPLRAEEKSANGPVLNVTRSTTFVVTNTFRTLRLTAFVFLGVTGAVLAGIEGLNLYGEKLMLPAHENNPDIRRWGWDAELDHWNGDPDATGTDPSLTYGIAHRVRAAWLILNYWSTSKEQPGLPPRVDSAASQLQQALLRMEPLHIEGKLHKDTFAELSSIFASLAERSGPRNWDVSRRVYERVWAMLPASGPRSARVALAIGNLSYRLGEKEAALDWWKNTVSICLDSPVSDDPTQWIPKTIPDSPASQRTLASVFVAISAQMAASGEYKQAERFQRASLDFLRTIPAPTRPAAQTSPAEALHHLYLLQCSSVLSIHIAEVLCAQNRPTTESLAWLDLAATTSQKIISSATAQDVRPLESAHPFTLPLPQQVTSSNAMTKVANRAIIDASSTAADALNLSSLLLQRTDPATASKALEKVLWWSTTRDDKGKYQAAPGVLEDTWKDYLGRLEKLRSQAQTS